VRVSTLGPKKFTLITSILVKPNKYKNDLYFTNIKNMVTSYKNGSSYQIVYVMQIILSTTCTISDYYVTHFG